MKRKAVISLSLGILFSVSAQAETLSLERVLEQVSQTHPAIRGAKAQVRAAKAKRVAESWLPDPEMGVEFEEVPLRQSSPGNAGMTNYMVKQEIPFPTKLATKSLALRDEMRAQESLADGVSRGVVFETKKTYYEFVAAQNETSAVRAMIGQYNQMVNSLEGTYASPASQNQVGFGGMSGGSTPAVSMQAESGLADILMAKMKRAELDAQLSDLHHKSESARAKLNLLMGREAGAGLTVKVPEAKSLSIDMKTLAQKVTLQNADLSAMRHLIDKADKDVSLSKQNYLPDFMPEFAYNQRQNMENAYTLKLNLKVPLWLPKNAASVRQAKAEREGMASEYSSELLNAKADLYYLWEHAHRHASMLGKYKNEVLPLARSAYNTAVSSYQIDRGAVLATTALTSLINYHQAQLMYWDLWMDYMTEYAMLEKLAGQDL